MKFHNPYHFVPVKERDRSQDLTREQLKGGDVGNVTHALFGSGTHSGRLVCRITAEDAIVVGAERTPASDEAAAVVTPFERDGRPAIPASSLRGLISSVAEAASNSALRVLEDRAYSYRKKMSKSLSAIGMVVERTDDTGVHHELRPLTLPTIEIQRGVATLPLAYQGLFPIPNLKVYIGNRASIRADDYPYETFRRDSPKYYGMKLKRDRAWGKNYSLENDTHQYRKAGRFLLAQKPLEPGDPIAWDDIPEDQRPHYVRGILRVLGCTAARSDIPEKTKLHEIFIPYPADAENWPCIPIDPAALDRFNTLASERSEARKNPPFLPYEPKGTVRNPRPKNDDDHSFRLKDGDLVFFDAANKRVTEFSLSSIWRGGGEKRAHQFFSAVDLDLIPFHSGRQSITPAEQLFGLVEQGTAGEQEAALALAGRVRFSDALLYATADTVPANAAGAADGAGRFYEEPVTLKILDSPKPPCPCLYFKSADGGARYIEKPKLAPGHHRPQGRKFYLHYRSQDGARPWKTEHATERLSQKALVTPIRRGSVFYFHVDFENLSDHELGMLLYALRPTPEFRHKLGMGKSIGLGRVRTDVVALLAIDRGRRYSWDGLFEPRYSSCWIDPNENVTQCPPLRGEAHIATGGLDVPSLREAFRSGMDADIRNALELLGCPAGLTAPVQTPLAPGQTDPEDETFEWFVLNDEKCHQMLKPLDASSRRLPTLSDGTEAANA